MPAGKLQKSCLKSESSELVDVKDVSDFFRNRLTGKALADSVLVLAISEDGLRY